MPDRPDSIPTWATDDAFNAPGLLGDGQANKVAPPAGKARQGFFPAERPEAEVWNRLFHLGGAWAEYFAGLIGADEELTYQEPKPRVVWVPAEAGLLLPLTDAQPNDPVPWAAAGFGALRSTANGVRWLYHPPIPSGMILTEVAAKVQPGNARGVGSRMDLDVVTVSHPADLDSPNSTPTVQVDSDDGTTNIQGLVIETSRVVVRSTSSLVIQVQAGDDGAGPGAHQGDQLLGVRLTFNDVGPRNG